VSALPRAGTVLRDRYELLGEIGRGGYSVVYEAHDREVGSRLAVKLLVPPPALVEKARERMRREVLAVRSLRHPHIVRVYDYLEDGDWSFVVMEKVAGGDLHARVARRGPLAPDEARRIGAELASALAEAHRNGILHRDVKPHNVLLGEGGRALLSDFGSARIDGESTLTATGQFVGTLETMAPELLQGARADARADVYALGVTLYHALTGAFPEKKGGGVLPSARPDGHHPRQVRSELPAELDAVVAHATREDPRDRFPTAALLGDALAGRFPPSLDATLPVVLLESCVLCGLPDPLSLGVCSACRSREGAGGERLLFVQRGLDWQQRRELVDTLGSVRGAESKGALEAAARGERALLAVPAAHAERLAQRLAERGVAVRSVLRGSAWRALPGSFRSVLAANLLLGGALGVWVEASYAVWAALVVLVLGAGAGRLLCRPVLRSSAAPSRLPGRVESRAVDALAALPSGPTRDLLGDIVRSGRDLFDAPATAATSTLGGRVAELMLQSCDAARDLGAMDRALEALEKHRVRSAERGERWSERLADVERARDALVQRLLEALGALVAVRSEGLEGSLGSLERLEALTAELESEREIQAAAAREVAELLETGRGSDAFASFEP
jgi:hypothetical protein